ncbi:peptidoglycan DD-metalloendopeptidase family protein [Tunicatimonas pelagia]|uniref:peptidoglycan DD-metalloendopeptidase family protein n=1 Tax=Tunicatimonas pelagia TaxID=931531 RepID=UPI002665EBD7|nr:peptidoglycan DD-metalloendopeptidase family protein [Tunicatimonas pelagia]WKN43928.1 peptidoglycan DD-metalloendopeptidase family protein [Tunicatimonas pelagia]
MKKDIEKCFQLCNDQMGQVFPKIAPSDLQTIDLSSKNLELSVEVVSDTAHFNQVIDTLLAGKVGIGGFLEHRSLYQRSSMYQGEEPRCIHLGVDVWAPARTKVHAPWPGKVHSFQDNQGFGNYGPTIILEHAIEAMTFFTLYGHLSRSSLKNMQLGQTIEKNQLVGELGDFPENGDWPPHLHFQAMTDLLGNMGDFPGVVTLAEQYFYQTICIDPQLLLTFKER